LKNHLSNTKSFEQYKALLSQAQDRSHRGRDYRDVATETLIPILDWMCSMGATLGSSPKEQKLAARWLRFLKNASELFELEKEEEPEGEEDTPWPWGCTPKK
jgi:hypothetical protein